MQEGLEAGMRSEKLGLWLLREGQRPEMEVVGREEGVICRRNTKAGLTLTAREKVGSSRMLTFTKQ